MAYYTANGTRLKATSNGFKMLRHLYFNGATSKYDLLTKVLHKPGSKPDLRGYYSCYFRGLVDSGVLFLDKKTGLYSLTDHGLTIYAGAVRRSTSGLLPIEAKPTFLAEARM